jgi:hypothetical protein
MARYEEALADLRNYLGREQTALLQYPTLGTEVWLACELYVDEEFGPIWIQGYVDRIALDFDEPGILHGHDWKTNRTPPNEDDVRGSAQLRGYAWQILQCWEQIYKQHPRGHVAMHLDAIKWRELPGVMFTELELDAWHGWMVAIVKEILRDETAEPELNPDCAYCPVKDTCPAYQAIPDLALELMSVKPQEAKQLVEWRDRANAARLMLEKAVDEVDGRFKDDANRLGRVVAGDYEWVRGVGYKSVTDMRDLHAVAGDPFYDAASITKKALGQLAALFPPSKGALILGCMTDVPSGTKIYKNKLVKE